MSVQLSFKRNHLEASNFFCYFLRQNAAKCLNRTIGISLISILPYDFEICFWGTRVW